MLLSVLNPGWYWGFIVSMYYLFGFILFSTVLTVCTYIDNNSPNPYITTTIYRA